MKKALTVCSFFLLVTLPLSALSGTIGAPEDKRKWHLVLPLRFTQLQNKATMLSGIRLGTPLSPKINAAVSVYHSFYLTSFKARADLQGFDKQPRLFINGAGIELEYVFFRKNRLSASVQLLTGWGFMKYDLHDHRFKSKQVNYVLLEPALNLELAVGAATALGFGLGYRPILSQRTITYTSELGNGHIPVSKQLPNGVNVLLCLKGFL